MERSFLAADATADYRGTERISSNALLNLLEVGADPVTRQKLGFPLAHA